MELQCYFCGNTDTITVTKSKLSEMTKNIIVGNTGMVRPEFFVIISKTLISSIYKIVEFIGLKSKNNTTLYVYCKKCGAYKKIE
ncbi:MAG: hypothetical protein V1773_15510 [bacterium]